MRKPTKIKMDDKYYRQCEINTPSPIKQELSTEKELFEYIVATLVVNSPEALTYDPDKKWSLLNRAEGGFAFKDTWVAVRILRTELKTSEIPLEQQNPIYPIIVAKVINELTSTYQNSSKESVKDKLIDAAIKILPPQLTQDEFLSEIENRSIFRMLGKHIEDFFK